jgi:TatD DNase family protein
LFDSHCHLTDAAFAADLEDVLSRAQAAGINGIVTIASNADDAGAAWSLAGRHAAVWCTAGIHPHEASTAERDFGRIREAVTWPRVVAVGETGLDYHYDNSPRDVQRRSFTRHLELAAETGLPVVVHSREAEADTVAALRAAGRAVRGVMHCFSGGTALLEAALERDWYVSFAGVITFRNFQGADLLRRVPLDRLLLETDGPYLAPVPHRGRRNEPAWLAATCAAAASLRGEDLTVLADASERNAHRFYRLDDAAGATPAA